MSEPCIAARRACSNHRAQVLASEVCGCFYCLSTFVPGEITAWVDDDPRTGTGTTALCPRCGIDAVIGSASGFAITPELLRRMQEHWF